MSGLGGWFTVPFVAMLTTAGDTCFDERRQARHVLISDHRRHRGEADSRDGHAGRKQNSVSELRHDAVFPWKAYPANCEAES